MIKRSTAALALTLAGLLLPAATGAQTNVEINGGIQFDFSVPGARSLGMGGAFFGLADDATAAITNPAGLTTLSRPEISVEGREWSFTQEFNRGGRGSGGATGFGADDVSRLVTGESEEDVTGLSFLSLVIPRRSWSVAFYRHELANFEAGIQQNGAFVADPDIPDPILSTARLFPVQAQLDLDIATFGISGAVQLTRKLSLGAGVAYHDFEIDSVNRRFSIFRNIAVEPANQLVDPGEFFGPPDFSAANVFNFQTVQGEDEDTVLIAGFLWRISDRVSLGGAYREGPSFEFATANRAGPAAEALGLVPADTVLAQARGEFQVPDIYGLGLAIRPAETFTIVLQWDRVTWSDLTDNVVDVFDGQGFPVANLEADDADEVRLGFEYVFAGARYPVALRWGGWHDPDHRLSFQGAATDVLSQLTKIAFPEGDDELHYSAGIGIVFGERFQLDAGADFSDLVDTASLSGVLRF